MTPDPPPPVIPPAMPAVIEYERGVTQIVPLENGVRIDIGPMSAAAFVVVLLPRVMGLLVGVVFLVIGIYTSWMLGLILPVLLILVSLYALVRAARHRGDRREITIHDGVITHSSPTTAGMSLQVIHEVGRVEVRRCPEMFWVWKLVVLPPKIKFLTGSLPTAGISTTLLIDGNRALLQQVAAEVKSALRLAETTHAQSP